MIFLVPHTAKLVELIPGSQRDFEVFFPVSMQISIFIHRKTMISMILETSQGLQNCILTHGARRAGRKCSWTLINIEIVLFFFIFMNLLLCFPGEGGIANLNYNTDHH